VSLSRLGEIGGRVDFPDHSRRDSRPILAERPTLLID
jgi:hypothetical protein